VIEKLGTLWRLLAALSFVASASTASNSCQPQPERGGQVGGGSEILLGAGGEQYPEDRRYGLRVYQTLDVPMRKKYLALTGPIHLIVAHELGHEFERIHGRPSGFGAEEFADAFAVNLAFRTSQFQPSGIAWIAAEIEAMKVFLGHVPPEAHLGGGEAAGASRRQNDYQCHFDAHLAVVARSDPFEEAAAIDGWGSGLVPWLRSRPMVGGLSQARWLELAWAEQAAARTILAQNPRDPGWLAGCVARLSAFRSHMLDRLSNDERLRLVLRDYDGLTTSEINRQAGRFRFEYERPETAAAWALFVGSAPETEGTLAGHGVLVAYLQQERWIGTGNPGLVTRVKYCGAGIANAYVSEEAGTMVMTLCYELLEDVIENISRYPDLDIRILRDARSFAYETIPDVMQRTDQYTDLP